MGENRNVREAGCEVEEGRREVSKSNEKLSERHAREGEGKWAAVALVLPRLGSEPARRAEAGRFATRLTGPILGKVAVPMTVDST